MEPEAIVENAASEACTSAEETPRENITENKDLTEAIEVVSCD